MTTSIKPIQSALISVFHKDRIDIIARKLSDLNVKIYSTGGTYDFIKELGIAVETVESLTSYPSIFDGRVKTLHPKIFGGILYQRELQSHVQQAQQYEISPIDLVIVDLYPFEDTVAAGKSHEDIIEKIDIGGISLIRGAAKNYNDVVIVPSAAQYDDLINLLDQKQGFTDFADREYFAMQAFNVSSHYDTAIFNYFNKSGTIGSFKQSVQKSNSLRYGENPHQQGVFYGDLDKIFTQLHGKEISYNNLVDLEASLALIKEFNAPTFTVIKHTNACGVASDNNLKNAWIKALAGDPVSAYGGVIATNRKIDEETAEEINKLFFEIIIAPDYEKNALEILKSKKNRIILQNNAFESCNQQFKSLLNGVILQEKDLKTETTADLQKITTKQPSVNEINDLLFANIIVKHLKSNAIVLAKNNQLLGAGCGMTSRVDALKHAINKAKEFNLDLKGAVMASDAFFPFADSIELANNNGITAVIQPGGSVRDQDTIDFCNKNDIAMVFTGIRHFKH